MRHRLVSLFAVCLVAASSRVPAQTVVGQPPPSPPTLRTSVTTIQVDAVVTRNGQPVRDLTADDFVVTQDSRRQRITTFTYVSVDGTDTAAAPANAPVAASADSSRQTPPARASGQEGRHLVFVVDDLGLSHESMYRVKTLLKDVIERDVTAADRVAVVRTGGETGLYQQFTNEKPVLRALVDRLRFHMGGRGLPDDSLTLRDAAVPVVSGGPTGDDGGGNGGGANGPSGSDATTGRRGSGRSGATLDLAFAEGTIGTLNAVVASLRDVDGRKGVVLLTDGFALDEAGLLQALNPIVDLATRTRTVIYSVNVPRFNPAAGVGASCCPANPSRYQADAGTQAIQRTRRAVDDLQSLKQGPDFLATETGGLFFANPSDLSQVVRRSLDDQQGYYLLGYSPDDRTYQDPADRFHKIAVSVKKPGHAVRARSGYLGSPARPVQTRTRSPLTDAALSAFSRNELDVRLTAFFMAPDGKAPIVRTLLHLDRQRLTFVAGPNGESPAAEVELEAYAVTAQGAIVGRDRQTVRIRDAGAAAGSGPAATADKQSGADQVGFLYRLDVPVEKPGAYSLRVAVRDRAAGGLGSASQFVIVPDLGADRLALSGLIVGASEGEGAGTVTTAHPAVRRFGVPSKLTYTLQIYNARYRDDRPALQAQAEILKDDRVVYAGPALDVQTGARRGEPITVAGVLALARGFAPGTYALRVTVRDRHAAPAPPVSTVMDFIVVTRAAGDPQPTPPASSGQ